MRFLVAIVLVVAATSFVVSNAIGQTYIPLVASGPATSTPTLIPPPTDAPLATDTSVPTPTNTAIATNPGVPTSTPTFTPTPTETSVEVSTEMPINTSTSTPTETATPTATSTDVAVGITVLDNHSTYVDSIDYLHVVGEARNDTSNKARFMEITVNFFNAQNQLTNTENGYVRQDVLEPGQTSCFHVLVSGNPAYSYYEFETDYSTTSEEISPISIVSHSGAYHATFDDWYEIIGQASNDGNEDENYPEIVGTLYIANDKVIGCNSTYTSADTLTPGQVSSWKITFLHAPEGTVTNYRVQGN
jgi:hypothetical protein